MQVEVEKEDEDRIRNTIYSEMRRAQGNYAKQDMTKLEETPFGRKKTVRGVKTSFTEPKEEKLFSKKYATYSLMNTKTPATSNTSF